MSGLIDALRVSMCRMKDRPTAQEEIDERYYCVWLLDGTGELGESGRDVVTLPDAGQSFTARFAMSGGAVKAGELDSPWDSERSKITWIDCLAF